MGRPSMTLRPVEHGDEEFLYRLYASTREEELAGVRWTGSEKESFLRWQFDAQDRHYREHYPGASFQVILVDDAPAGRLYVERREVDIRIIDIALLPPYRRHGLGSALLHGLMEEAAGSGKSLSLHVEHYNPAYGLYRRLGFRKISDTGVYDLLEWRAP